MPAGLTGILWVILTLIDRSQSQLKCKNPVNHSEREGSSREKKGSSSLLKMDGYILQFQSLCKARVRRVVFVIGMMVSVVLVFQAFTIPSRNSLPPLFPAAATIPVLDERSLPDTISSPQSVKVGMFSLLSDSQGGGFGIEGIDGDVENGDIDLDRDGDPDRGRFPLGIEDGPMSEKIKDPAGDVFALDHVVDSNAINFSEAVRRPGTALVFEQTKILGNESVSLPLKSSTVVSNDIAMNITSVVSLPVKDPAETVASSVDHANNEALVPLDSGSGTTNANSLGDGIQLVKKKKKAMPSVHMMEMNQLLLRNHAAYHSMRARWPSVRDKEIISAKAHIEKAPIVKNEQELYAPLFRNISMFKKSYELMEHMLKVYIYKEGKKPIFHQPLLKGIYASEGWFMKLMETNRQFVVKDPRRAHLFYMPFSSRYLQFALYVPNSHNRRNLEQHLKNYVDLLATKYPFWNRTGGADHFLVACHDWAPYETRHAMERSIRALCNADIHGGFRLGKDVSLPETYVRSARNPLRDLGGRPADKRPTLAFYAGNMHGSLRPILVQHWENKDPDMKIFGPMPAGVKSKMTYIQHMKTSKYCICPRGYEVNSPRVVESIFYECVPVLISDNYVPPFFEVLNWEAFSVILPEKDVPRLKEILESIPEENYLALQMGVRKVQQHFLWHSKPVKYDLFHMTLHSIWFNRVYQIRPR